MIGAPVTAPAWPAQVPGDLPVLVVAEGLTMYLAEEQGRALFGRIVDHCPGGRFVFDALSRRGIRRQKFTKAIHAADRLRVLAGPAKPFPTLKKIAARYRLAF